MAARYSVWPAIVTGVALQTGFSGEAATQWVGHDGFMIADKWSPTRTRRDSAFQLAYVVPPVMASFDPDANSRGLPSGTYGPLTESPTTW